MTDDLRDGNAFGSIVLEDVFYQVSGFYAMC